MRVIYTDKGLKTSTEFLPISLPTMRLFTMRFKAAFNR